MIRADSRPRYPPKSAESATEGLQTLPVRESGAKPYPSAPPACPCRPRASGHPWRADCPAVMGIAVDIRQPGATTRLILSRRLGAWRPPPVAILRQRFEDVPHRRLGTIPRRDARQPLGATAWAQGAIEPEHDIGIGRDQQAVLELLAVADLNALPALRERIKNAARPWSSVDISSLASSDRRRSVSSCPLLRHLI